LIGDRVERDDGGPSGAVNSSPPTFEDVVYRLDGAFSLHFEAEKKRGVGRTLRATTLSARHSV